MDFFVLVGFVIKTTYFQVIFFDLLETAMGASGSIDS